jgi:hypothetical protein
MQYCNGGKRLQILENDLLINQLDNSLIEEIFKEYPEDEAEYIIIAVSDNDEYEYICLEDFGYLPTQLNELVTLYLRIITRTKGTRI